MIGGLFQTAGCIISSDDGRDGAVFDVSWSAAACPPGAAARILSEDTFNGQRFTDIHDCSAGRGSTAPLPPGDYLVWLEVTSPDNSELYVQSLSVASSVAFDGDVATVDIPSFEGFFGFTWNLIDTNGTPLTCEEVNADGVDIIATLASTSVAFVDVFNCADLAATTNALLVGTHTIVVDVLQGEEPLGTSQAREETITFDDVDQVVDIGNFEFTFAP